MILDRVASLHFPDPTQVVIGHGSALVTRDIRMHHPDGDIDITVSLENLKHLREIGFVAVRMVVGADRLTGKPKEIVSTRGGLNPETGVFEFDAHQWDFSRERYNQTGKGRIYLNELIARSTRDADTGIAVANLELVAETKRETGRSKDEVDLALIAQAIGTETQY